MNPSTIGNVSVIIGILVLVLTLYIVFVPSSYLPLPSIIVGVASIASAIVVVIAITGAK